MKPVVFLVGAGPGDPMLLTLRAKELLENASCILYDFLVHEHVLDMAPESAEKICVGKRKNFCEKTQDETNDLLVQKAKQHGSVIRLKGGTPLFFGKGYEEKLFIEEYNIDCKIIPGVSAANAVPESFDIPLTLAKKFSSIAYCSGHHQHPKDIPVPSAQTVCYFMSLTNVPVIVTALFSAGWNKTTPCALLSHGTLPDAKKVVSTLENIQSAYEETPLFPPAMFLVGDILLE